MRSVNRSRNLVVGLVVAATAATWGSGCAADGDGGSPSGSGTVTTFVPTPNPSSTSTDQATPSSGARPPVDSLVLSTSGLGPLTIGIPPETNPGAAMIEFDPDFCAGVSDGTDPQGDGRWVAAYPPFVDAGGDSKPQFWVEANNSDGVYWIDVVNPAIPTTAGIRVGSTLAELQAAYPDLVAGTPGPTSQPFWVADAAGLLAFEVGSSLDAQQPPTSGSPVVVIRVQGPGTDPDWTSANTDLVAGGCL